MPEAITGLASGQVKHVVLEVVKTTMVCRLVSHVTDLNITSLVPDSRIPR